MNDPDEFDVEADRRMVCCDHKECGATKALIRVAMPSGGTLKYCAHHATHHRAKLNALGAYLYELSA